MYLGSKHFLFRVGGAYVWANRITIERVEITSMECVYTLKRIKGFCTPDV